MKHTGTYIEFLLVAALVVIFIVPRATGMNQFLSIDESDWVTVGANYYYALTHFDFANTVYYYHPGITTAWIVLLGTASVFPGYYRLQQGYLNDDTLDIFLLQHGVHPMEIVVASRLIQVIILAGLMLVVYFLLRKLAGRFIAFSSLAWMSVDPFFLGHSRLLNHEAMLSQFLMISLLGMFVYLYRNPHPGFLVLSGLAASLANLTKSSAFLIVLTVGLLLLIKAWQDGLSGSISRTARTLALWLGILSAAYVLFWPGMWVTPGKMLYEVYGNAIGYALEGRPVTQPVALPLAPVGDKVAETLFFLTGMLWRTSPLTWAGVLLGLGFLLDRRSDSLIRLVTGFLAGLAILFVALFGLASGRNSPHYILTSYVALDLLAGTGFAWGLNLVAKRYPALTQGIIRGVIIALFMAIQIFGWVSQYPYYYTYYNPVMAAIFPDKNPNSGYAELLEQAGHYLSSKESADELKVISWYARGPFSYFFPGQAQTIKLVSNVDEKFVKILRDSDYLVIYPPQQERRNIPANLLQALKTAQPEKVIWFNGIDYVRIYHVKDLPAGFYESLH